MGQVLFFGVSQESSGSQAGTEVLCGVVQILTRIYQLLENEWGGPDVAILYIYF